MTQEALKLALEKIATVNAMDYEYQAWAREALAQPEQEQEHDNSATHLAHCYQGEYPVCKYGDENCPAIPKVKTQPEQEPMAWMCSAFDGEPCEQSHHDECENPIPLYAHPPQRTWVGLTNQQIEHLWETRVGQPCPSYPLEKSDWVQFAQAIEAKLKQLNT
jgi:hypothetical protein